MTTVAVIVLDGFGIGHAPDAAAFGTAGANTASAVLAAVDRLGLTTPHLDALGLRALLAPHACADSGSAPLQGAAWALTESSGGCDTPTGHWELMGQPSPVAPPTYPDGFDPDLLAELAIACGVDGWLANGPVNGLVVLNRCGAEHVATQRPIVYTSADSVIQIAAHEEHFGLERLWALCVTVRQVLSDRAAASGTAPVGRVIARPFTGTDGAWVRTANRRDWAVPPPFPTALDLAAANGIHVTGVGKIGDVFTHRGLDAELHPSGDASVSGPGGLDAACLAAVVSHISSPPSPRSFVFANLVQFDTLFGHLRDVDGYARHLAWFDSALGVLLAALGPTDRVVLTADHGNDPTAPGSDHTREQVPALVYGPDLRQRGFRGAASMADLGPAILAYFELSPSPLAPGLLDLN